MEIIKQESNLATKGRKGGGKAHTPVETQNNLLSTSYAKVLVAVGEGPLSSIPTGRDIFLGGTPLIGPTGLENFGGVKWEWRSGTSDQAYIQGMPETAHEITVGYTLENIPYTRLITDSTLDAMRVTLQWPALMQTQENGDVVGYVIEYAIDVSTDGGQYVEVLKTKVDGKTNTSYERTHRINLPQEGSSWTVRVRRLTAKKTDSKVSDIMYVKSVADVVDAKLRYPNTALLYLEFDAQLFGGTSIPKISVRVKGRQVRVPTNYDPESRTYSGIWNGTFKWAYSNNPAWVLLDICTNERFGLGGRLTVEDIDIYTLYQIAQYCDVMVSDGAGGTEPRYTYNGYLQNRAEAWQVLRDIVNRFNGMLHWNGSKLVATADMPVNVASVQTYSRSQVIGGKFTYSTPSEKTIYTSAVVSYDDPTNHFETAKEAVNDLNLVARWKTWAQTDLTAIGCTSRGEAQRLGKYTMITNSLNRIVTFDLGMQGYLPAPGQVIGVADELLAGEAFAGRISSATSTTVTLDRASTAVAGDILFVNMADGVTGEGRTVKSVAGKVVTVTAAYTQVPNTELGWYLEKSDLKSQLFRVSKVSWDEENNKFTVIASQYEDSKYAAVDNGARLETRPITKIPAGGQEPPAAVTVGSYSYVEQTLSVTTMRVSWEAVKGAMNYEAQWRKDGGDWVNVGETASTGFEVKGIYKGAYQARVRAINAIGVKSIWKESTNTTLVGKVGLPPTLASLTTVSEIFGIRLNWTFPAGAQDTAYIQLQQATTIDGQNTTELSTVAYPATTYLKSNMLGGVSAYFRGRLIDRSGNEGPWTSWIYGVSEYDADKILDYIAGEIGRTELGQELLSELDNTKADLTDVKQGVADATADVEAIQQQVQDTNQQLQNTVAFVNTAVQDLNSEIDNTWTQLSQQITDTKNSVTTLNQTVTNLKGDVTALAADVDADVAALNQSLSGLTARTTAVETKATGLRTDLDAAVKAAEYDVSKAYAVGDIVRKGQRLYQALIAVPVNKTPPNSMYWKDVGTTLQEAGATAAQVATNTTTITNQGNTLTSHTSQLTGLTTRITNAETNITGNATALNNLTSTVTQQGNTLTSQGQSITNVQATVDGIAGAGTNLLEDTYSWLTSTTMPTVPGSSGLVKNAVAVTGSDSGYGYQVDTSLSTFLMLSPTNATAGRNVSLVPGTYLVSMYVNASVAGQMDVSLYDGTHRLSARQTQPTTRTRMVFPVTVTDTARISITIYTNRTAIANHSVVIDSVMIEKRVGATNVASPFVPGSSAISVSNNASATTALTARVSTAEGNITSQGNSITSLGSRVTTAEGKITSQGTAISELSSTTTSQGNAITSQGTSITNLQASVGNIATDNLLSDPTFANSNGLTSVPTAVVLNRNDASVPAGAPSSRVVKATAATSTGNLYYGFTSAANTRTPENGNLSQIAVQAGETYDFELYSYVTVSRGQVGLWIQFYDTAGVSTGHGWAVQSGDGIRLTTTVGQWVKLTGTATVPANCIRMAMTYRLSAGDATDWFISSPVARKRSGQDNAQAQATTALESRVTATEGGLTSQSSSITNLTNSLSTTNTNVTAAQTAANAANTLAGGKGKVLVQTATPAAADQLVQNLWIDITGGANTPKRWTGSAWTAVTDKVATDAAAAAANALSVANTKADASAVSSLTSRVTAAEGTITSQGQSITSLNSSISSISGTGSNMLPAEYCTYTDTLPGLVVGGGITAAIDTDDVAFNGYALKLQKNSGTATVYLSSSTVFTTANMVLKQKKYIVSMYARAGTDGHQFRAGFRAIQADGTVVFHYPSNMTVGTTWARYTTIIDMTSSPADKIILCIDPKSGTGAYGVPVWVDKIMVEEQIGTGTTPSAFVIGNSAGQVAAQGSALQSLTNRVTSAEGTITSQGQAITSLTATVNNKADSSALTSLTNRVTATEGNITAQGQSITSLNTSIGNTTQDDVMLNPNWDAAGYLKTENGSLYQQDYANATDAGVPANPPAGRLLWRLKKATDNNWGGVVLTSTYKIGNDYQIFTRANAGDVINISCHMFCENAVTNSGKVCITPVDSSGSTLGVGNVRVLGYVAATGGWQALSTQYTLPAGAAGFRVYLATEAVSPVGFKMWVGNMRVAIQSAGEAANAAATAALTSTVTQQGSTVTSQGQSITSLNNSLSNISGTGTNLLNDNYSWLTSTTLPTMVTSLGTTTGVAVAGSDSGFGYSMTVSSNSIFSYMVMAPANNTASYNMSLEPGTYLVSMYIKGSAAGQAMANLYDAVLSRTATVSYTTTRTRYVFPIVVTSAIKCGLLIYPNRQGAASVTVVVDSVMVEKKIGNGEDASPFVAGSSAQALSANAAAVQALTNRVTASEGTITTQGQSITSLTNTVANKADASAVTALSNRVTAAEGSITSQGSSITSLNNSLNGIGGSGNNLLEDTYSWLGTTTMPQTALSTAMPLTSVSDSTVASGFRYRIERGNAANPWMMFCPSNNAAGWNIPITPGKYIVSFYANTNAAGVTNGVVARCGLWDGSSRGTGDFTLTTTRTRYSVVSTAVNDAKHAVTIWFPSGASGDVVWIDSVMVERQIGNSTTPSAFVAGPSAVGLTATSSALQSVTSRVTTAEGAITSQSGALTALKNSLGGSGTNLIPAEYSAFTATKPNMVYAGTIGSTAADVEAFTGYAYKVTTNTTNTGASIYTAPLDDYASYSMACSQGKYILSYYAKADTAGHTIALFVRGRNNAGAASSSAGAPQDALTTSWQRYSYVVDLSSATWAAYDKATIGIQVNRSGVSGRVFYLDKIMLEKQVGDGTTPSAFVQGSSFGQAVATSDAVTGLTSRVTAAEGTITTQGTSITNLTNRMTTAEGNISSTSGALATLTSTVTTQGNTITSQGNSLTSLTASLSQQSDNLILKGTFEDGDIGPWTASPTIVNVTAHASWGKAIQFYANSFCGVAFNIAVGGGEEFDCSADIWNNYMTAGQTTRLQMQFYDKAGTNLGYFTAFTCYAGTTGFQTYSGRITAPVGAVTARFVIRHETTTSTGRSLWCNIVARRVSAADSANAAATAALTSTVTAQGNTVTSQGQSITSLSNTLNAINGAVNLLPAEFSVFGSTVPTIHKQANVTITTEANASAYNGYNLKVASSTTQSNYFYLTNNSTDYPLKLKPSKPYILSFWVQADAARTMSARIRYKNSAGTVVETQLATIAATTTWTRVSAVMTMPAALVDDAQIVFFQNATGAASTHIYDGFMLEEQIGTGTAPSTFSVGNSARQYEVQANALSSLTNRVTTAEGTITSQGNSITSLNNSVANKADSSALTALTSRVTTAEGKITSQGSSITDLTANAATVAPDNFVNDPTFASGHGTNQSSSVVLDRTDASVPAGSPSARVIKWSVATTTGNLYMGFNVTANAKSPESGLAYNMAVTGGDVYDFELYAYSSVARQHGLWIQMYDAAGTSITHDWAATSGDGIRLTSAAATWTKLTGTRTIPAGVVRMALCFRASVGNASDIFLSSPVINKRSSQANSQASALSALDTRVTTAEGTITSQGSSITSLNNTVANKADNSALSALTSRVTTAEGNISSQGSSVTQLQSQIGGVAGAGINLLSDEYSWLTSTTLPATNGSGTTTVGVAVSGAVNGTGYGYKMTATSASTGCYLMLCPANNVNSFNVPIEPGTYIVSFYASTPSTASVRVRLYSTTTSAYSVAQTVTSTRTRYSHTVTIGAASTMAVLIYYNWLAVSGQEVTVDSVMIEKQVGPGTTASPFVAGPSARAVTAQASALSSLTSTVTQQGNTISSQATSISNLNTSVGTNTTNISTISSTQNTTNGKLNALYSVKLGVNSNGQYYGAGMGIGIENTPSGMQSQVLFVADRFAILNSVNGTASSPFVVQNGQTFISQAFISQATVNNMLVNAYVESARRTNWGPAVMTQNFNNGNIQICHPTMANTYVDYNQNGVTVVVSGIVRVRMGVW